MSTRDDMIELYPDRYLEKCKKVLELRWQVWRWQCLAWLLGIIAAVELGILIWG